MQNNTYNIINLETIYEAVFGYRALPFPMLAGNINLGVNLEEKMSKLGAAIFKADANGRPAFCPVTLSKIVNGKTVKNYDLPFSTISMTLQKNIVSTPLIGRRGSVKELISIDDYKFTIQGILMTNGDVTEYDLPQAALDELRDLWEIAEPVALKNAFTEIFLKMDNSVVIESIELPDMKGISGAQAYSISLVSDTILELEDQ